MLLSLLSKRTLRADFRDAYGFTVRPQYLETFKEFDRIYKNEEEERSTKWRIFLQQHSEVGETNTSIEEDVTKADADVTEHETKHVLETIEEEDVTNVDADVTEHETEHVQETIEEENVDVSSDEKPTNDDQTENAPEEVVSEATEAVSEATEVVSEATKIIKPVVQNWAEVRSSLNTIENMMCHRVKNVPKSSPEKHLQTIQEVGPTTDDSNEELKDSEQPNSSGGSSAEVNPESLFPWKELESLVRGGVPRDLRGEAWQAFVGVKERRVESYYQNLLNISDTVLDITTGEKVERAHVPEQCKKQIEKDLPRTFPGHPALNEEGRNSLRRLLLAYARHNPDVGYCQAMNFFAAMLLLMMPEENAFWTLVGIIDNYFDGYFTTDMIESQVDQLVFEDLMRERYPNLVDHFDRMGVEMGWICGPWFLSIFVNMIPWESVLRVWDIILFEGNRAMLLRTALALMELYGPDVGSTMDAGDAITLLQSLVGSTFDSSYLIVTACISFSYVTEDTLQALRQKHRPEVIAAVQERMKGEHLRKSSKGLATKLYSFKKEREPIVRELSTKQGLNEKGSDKDSLDLMSPLKRDMSFKMEPITEIDSITDLQDQVIWLKAQLCSMLEDKRSATVRAEELETALMEMAQQDNKREMSARIEDMEHEVSELEQLLADKKEQEKAMLEVLMRVEQEYKIAEDARRSAERDAAIQRHLVRVLEEKYEQTMNTLAQMEKRAVMAESMLEATKQYDSSQVKPQIMPGNIRPESVKDNTTKKTGILSFGLGWREKNKGKHETSDAKSETNGHQEP